MKIDIVTWTYNSAKTLDKCLPTIDLAIPGHRVCHKIAVDGGSMDGTEEVLRRYGWTVEKSSKKGIPYQANQALGLVDTEFFASFEHDIILNPNWFERTSTTIISDETVGAVQGIRLYTGSKTMQAIEEWQYRTQQFPPWTFSIDNVLYRTRAVRHAGGFSLECMASADGILRRNMFKTGYKWITDTTLISGHYRKNFLEQFKHQMKAVQLARYYWSSNPESRSVSRRLLSMLGGNPFNVLNLTLQSRMLRVPIAWYILRFEKGVYLNLPHEDKAVRPVAMDNWYLTEFQKAVRNSSRSLSKLEMSAGDRHSPLTSQRVCEWCGKAAPLAYTIPRAWGNILPKLHPGFGQRFLACSVAHADRIAEKIFRDAFEYITLDNSL